MTFTVLHGDCIEVMQHLPGASVDFVLTDPPYLLRYRARDGRTVANDDHDEWLQPAFREIYRVLKPDSLCVSFYGWNSADRFIHAWKSAGFRIVGHFVFPKRYSSSKGLVSYQHEQAYLLAKGRPKQPEHPISDVVNWVYTGNRYHPTEKSVDILKPLIRAFTQPGELVFDPFCGSGSTLLAANMLGRRALGIELEPKHCLVASGRLAEAANVLTNS